MQNLRGVSDVLQALLDEVLVLLQVRQVLLGTLNRLIGANNLSGQLNGALQVREVLELHVHRRDTRLSCLRNLILRRGEQHLRLIGKQLFHVHVGALHRRINLFNTGVHLLEPRQGLHVRCGGHQLLGTAQQQNHLVVCVPQVSDALRVGGDGNFLAVNVLNDLGAVAVILHEEAGVLLRGIARSRNGGRGRARSRGGGGVRGTATGQGSQQQGSGQGNAGVELRDLHDVSFCVETVGE